MEIPRHTQKNDMKYSKLISLFMAALTFMSCGGSDDGDEPTPEVLKATSARAEYEVNLSQNLLDAATVTIYYIDSNGQQAQENATSTIWTKAVSITSLPAKAGFSVQPLLKGEPTQEEYTIEADGKMTVTVLDQKGAPLSSGTGTGLYTGSKLEVKGQLGPDFLGQYLTRISGRLQDAKAIAADGSFSETTINWGGNADANDPNRDTEVTTGGATGTTRGVL